MVVPKKTFCPVMAREETVYIYAEANEQGKKSSGSTAAKCTAAILDAENAEMLK